MRVVRVDGIELVHDAGRRERRAPLTTLAAAAEFVGVPLGAPPRVHAGDARTIPMRPLASTPTAADGARGLVRVRRHAARRAARACIRTRTPTDAQLWPEHFDLAIELGDEDAGTRANYGASPGDDDDPGAVPVRRTVGAGPAHRPVRASTRSARRSTYDELRSGRADPDAAGAATSSSRARSCCSTAYRVHPGSLAAWRRRAPSPAWINRPPSSGRSSGARPPSTNRVSPTARSTCCARSPTSPTASPSTSSRTRSRPRRAPSAAAPIPEMVFASLLHDIGKAVSVPEPPGDRGRDHQAVRPARGVRGDPRPPGLPGPALLRALRRRPERPRQVRGCRRGSTSPRSSPTSGTRPRSTPTTTRCRSSTSSRSCARCSAARARSEPATAPADRRVTAMLLDGKVAIVSGVGPGLGSGERTRARTRRARRSCSRHAAPTTSSRCRRRSRPTVGARSRCRRTSSTREQVEALVDAHGRRPSGGSTSSSTTRSAWIAANRSHPSISRTGRRSTTSTSGARSG